MNDSFNRNINYLRISITDRCNLRCLYCMPEDGICSLKHSEVLRYEEIVKVVKAAASMGVSKIRITGGEPLVRPGVVDFVRMINAVEGIDDISLTTNGILLGDLAADLADAGLNRVNISLDTLDAEKFRKITRVGHIEKVFKGIEAAKSASLFPIKINTVVINGFNEQEIVPLSEWALENEFHLRFIEFMPVSDNSLPFNERYLSSDEIKNSIFSKFSDLKQCSVQGNGPAKSWCRDDKRGSLGLIEAVSHSFCSSCNRIRLTADGKLKPCLFSNEEVDLIPALRNTDSCTIDELRRLLAEAVKMKPESHGNLSESSSQNRAMSAIGG